MPELPQLLLSLLCRRKPDTVKQKNAFPPNFIHSLDSTHMMLTALHCLRWEHGRALRRLRHCREGVTRAGCTRWDRGVPGVSGRGGRDREVAG